MTPHDAATRERVREAVLKAVQGCGLHEILAVVDEATDAALSALQPPPKEWEVSKDTQKRWLMIRDEFSTLEEELRSVTPHLLRDLADGVGDGVLEQAWEKADDSFGTNGYVRNFLRALADTLEGKA